MVGGWGAGGMADVSVSTDYFRGCCLLKICLGLSLDWAGMEVMIVMISCL